jgi:hypothetical protein
MCRIPDVVGGTGINRPARTRPSAQGLAPADSRPTLQPDTIGRAPRACRCLSDPAGRAVPRAVPGAVTVSLGTAGCLLRRAARAADIANQWAPSPKRSSRPGGRADGVRGVDRGVLDHLQCLRNRSINAEAGQLIRALPHALTRRRMSLTLGWRLRGARNDLDLQLQEPLSARCPTVDRAFSGLVRIVRYVSSRIGTSDKI